MPWQGATTLRVTLAVAAPVNLVDVDNGFARSTWNEHVTEGKKLRPKKGSH